MAKIGAGHFGAMLRLGLRELRAFFFPESNVAQPSEYGIFGTRTPGEVAADRRDAPAVVPSPGRSPAAIAAAAHAHDGHGGEPQRTPSQIAAHAHGGHGPEQHHGHGHEFGHGHEHEMGHGI